LNKLFILDDATVNLYPAGPDGRTVTGSALWIGACAETLTLSSRLEGVRFAATGARHASMHHLDEQHEIRINRLWVLRRHDLHDYKLERNQRYVMEIVWREITRSPVTGLVTLDEWYRNTYYGVTARSFDRASNSVMEFMADQVWDAEYYETASGDAAFTPNPALPDDDGTTDQVLWVHEEQIEAGDPVESYFTAVYRWPEDRVTVGAKAIGRSGNGSSSVFTLEVGGSLTAHTLTLPAATPGDEVQIDATFATVLPANQDVRWLCTSGPSGGDAPYAVAIVMTLKD
jgi:hypothetical protein